MPIDDNEKMDKVQYRDYIHHMVKKTNNEIRERRRLEKLK